MSQERLRRLEELLADRAAGTLHPDHQQELDQLILEFPEVDTDQFDLAAAELDLLWNNPEQEEEVISPELIDKLKANADGYFAGVESESPASVTNISARDHEKRASSYLPSWLAAAALLLVMFGAWYIGEREMQSGVAERTPEELREILLADGGDVLLTPMTATEDRSAVQASGDVIWSASQQAGFMRIEGLAPNNPSISQYQLWIFDSERDDRYPVDGGVFDIAATGETIVPIDPKIYVNEVALFAITVEKPGGVVVSDRERIVLVAQPD